MRTGKEYLASLRDGRTVYVGGELIEDITSHPKTRGYANAIAEYYDLHLDPKNQDIATFVDSDGNRQSMHWFLPRSKEDAARRRKYTDFLVRHFKGGIFTRPPAGMNVVMFTQVDDPKPWYENSRFKNGHRDLSGNIERQWAEVTSKDLAITPMFLDVQYRSRSRRCDGRDTDAQDPRGDQTRAYWFAAGRRLARQFRLRTIC